MNKDRTSISFSIIVPVYNRPAEIAELLQSLTRQTYTDFEVIVVDDGSSLLSEKIARNFMGVLNLKYFYKPNSGPGLSRNYGMQRASGNYFIILDSDVVVPEKYMQQINIALQKKYVDAFGGPDKEKDDFSPIQKAISFAMTSFLTTGGIRGKGNQLEKFHPRSFNMGLSKEVFLTTGGFSDLRYGEDIELSIRIMKAGFKTALLKDAYVYHKRRNSFKSFFQQVKHSGEARIVLQQKHPGVLKLVHWFPALFFTGGFISLILLLLNCFVGIFIYLFYFLLLMLVAYLHFKNFKLAVLSAIASFIMLAGYGWGFLKALFRRKNMGYFTFM